MYDLRWYSRRLVRKSAFKERHPHYKAKIWPVLHSNLKMAGDWIQVAIFTDSKWHNGFSISTEIGEPWMTFNDVMTADARYLCDSRASYCCSSLLCQPCLLRMFVGLLPYACCQYWETALAIRRTNSRSNLSTSEVPGSNRKVLGSDGIICKYLPLWVCSEFGMRACSLFRFVLIELRHRGEPSAILWVGYPYRAA